MSRKAEVSTLAQSDSEAEQIFYSIMMGGGDDLYGTYHALRAKSPSLLASDGTLVLSRHVDCDAALRHNALGKGEEYLKLKVANVSEEQLRLVLGRMMRTMIMTNPPDHTRLRRVVSAGFTGRHVEALRGVITERIDQVLDELADQPGGDFVSIVARALPCHVISDLLGVPEADRAAMMPNIIDLGLLVEPTATPDQMARGIEAEGEIAAYFAELLAHKRAHPADDLLTRMASTDAEEVLDDTEILATIILLFLAGTKTTSDALGNGMDALIEHPGEMQRLRTDPALIFSAVEEVLRYDAPLQLNARSVLEPVTFAGADLKPGQTVIILLGAANRDPERFEDPDRFDVGRTDNAHLTLSSGIHFCLGAGLARMEMEILYNRMLTGYKDVSAAGDLDRHQGVGMRAFNRIPVTLLR